MRTLAIGIWLLVLSAQSFAQNATIEKEITELSKAKWQWMADKNVDKLAKLYDDKIGRAHV